MTCACAMPLVTTEKRERVGIFQRDDKSLPSYVCSCVQTRRESMYWLTTLARVGVIASGVKRVARSASESSTFPRCMSNRGCVVRRDLTRATLWPIFNVVGPLHTFIKNIGSRRGVFLLFAG